MNVSPLLRFPHLAARDLEGRGLELPDAFSGCSISSSLRSDASNRRWWFRGSRGLRRSRLSIRSFSVMRFR